MKSAVRVMILLFAVVYGVGSAQSKVTLDSPKNRTEIPALTCISGRTADSKARLTAAVRALESGDVWIQGPLTVNGDRYEGMVHAGEASDRGHNGKWLEIRVFFKTAMELSEGQRLADWPDAEAASEAVRVQRKDGAPDGCGTARRVLPEKPEVSVTPMVLTVPPRSSGAVRSDAGVEPILRIGLILIFLLVLVAVAAMPATAETATMRLIQWLRELRDWWMQIARFATSTNIRFGTWLYEACGTAALTCWSARGYSGDLRQFSLALVLILPLMFATTTAFYAEAMTIRKGLAILFIADDVSGRGSEGILDQLLPGSPAVATVIATGAQPAIEWRILGQLTESFEKLWVEAFGFLAIALAGLQGAFGAVLLWRMGTERPLRLSMTGLLRERPMLTPLFLGLNLSLAILAAYRASEVATQGSWVVVAIVSGFLALTMSGILALSTHYCFECIADCLGVAKAIVLIAGFLGGALAVFSVAVLFGLSALAIAGAVLAGFFVFSIAASALLLFAKLMGDLVRSVRLPEVAAVGWGMPVRASAAILLAVVVTALDKVKSYRIWPALLLVVALIEPAVHAQTHDQADRAWAICIDTSLSPDGDQFDNLKAIISEIVKTRVSYNDTVWLAKIGVGRQPVLSFKMPAPVKLRSAGVDGVRRLNEAKEELLGAISRVSQVSGKTNLQIPIEAGFEMLRGENPSARRILVVGSDFLTDTPKAGVTSAPPPFALTPAAKGVEVLLLVMYPKPKYMERTGMMTPMALFHSIEERWSNSMRAQGAAGVRIRLVDSVPVRSGARPVSPRKVPGNL